MKKVVHLNESELVQLIKKVISEQTDSPEILKSILNMGFDKKYCPNYKPESESLAFEYCHKNNPSLVISYRDGGLEIVDLKKKKIINSWEVFKTEDLLDLEGNVKSLMGIKIQEESKLKTKMEPDTHLYITVKRINKIERTVQTMIFLNTILRIMYCIWQTLKRKLEFITMVIFLTLILKKLSINLKI